MASEFAIGGSFGGSSYNPFDPLAGLGLGSSSSATGSSPVATGSAASTGSGAGSSGSSSSGSSSWGGIFQDIANTALGWGSQVLAFDLFGRAQDAGVNTGGNQTTGSANTDTNTTVTGGGTSSGSMIAGVPSWLVYGGLGLLLLLVILSLVKG